MGGGRIALASVLVATLLLLVVIGVLGLAYLLDPIP
jgi:hypothetical protein